MSITISQQTQKLYTHELSTHAHMPQINSHQFTMLQFWLIPNTGKP